MCITMWITRRFTVLILESVLANVRAGNATVAAMEFEQYKGELLKNG